jgi:hypothetical protein
MAGTAGGGSVQMVARGVADVYLTANPTITFWRSVYSRYTNFAIEHSAQCFMGPSGFGQQLCCQIQRNADLIWQVWFAFTLPAIEPDRCKGSTAVYWVNDVGTRIIEEADLTIGGQIIDRQLGIWMYIWNELANNMSTHYLGDLTGRRYTVEQLIEDAKCVKSYFVPLLFWFCLSPGKALPLIALQYHDVRITIFTARFQDLFVSVGNPDAIPLSADCGQCIGNSSLIDAVLVVFYVYLDGEERARFAQQASEYLIEQLQFSQIIATPNQGNNNSACQVRIEINFNHPIKEFVWIARSNEATNTKNWYNFAGINGQDPIACVDLRINNHSRFPQSPSVFFRTVIPYMIHTNVPEKHIYCYGFGLDAERDQPNGSLNVSRLDSTIFLMFIQPCFAGCIQVFAKNYNVLRILGGMGGLAFAN